MTKPRGTLDATLVARLYAQSGAARWQVSIDAFRAALEASVAKAAPRHVEAYLGSLHLADLALACGCAAGDEAAWTHLVETHRPVLYRTADAFDSSGSARDVADALYADLFGVRESGRARPSLFRYFHGRSSLATWLRAVLAQRLVDRARERRRVVPLPDDESAGPLASPDAAPDPDRPRLVTILRTALAAVLAALAPRDRLRLGCYYAEDLTLAQIGRLVGEHEATVSRHLARTRRDVRRLVERSLRDDHQLDDAGIEACFAAVVADPGAMDVAELIDASEPRKNVAQERSTS